MQQKKRHAHHAKRVRFPLTDRLVIEGGTSCASVCLSCPLGGGGEINFEAESAVPHCSCFLPRSVCLGVHAGEVRGRGCADVEEVGERGEALGTDDGISWMCVGSSGGSPGAYKSARGRKGRKGWSRTRELSFVGRTGGVWHCAGTEQVVRAGVRVSGPWWPHSRQSTRCSRTQTRWKSVAARQRQRFVSRRPSGDGKALAAGHDQCERPSAGARLLCGGTWKRPPSLSG